VGPGEVGELLVRGPCVTPGYWRRVDPRNALNHLGGAHATGDLVSREEDGALVYRGRKDRMVKLDGFRVELGEIEAALLAHASVREAAVVHSVSEQRARLTAFIAPHADAAAPTLMELKGHCGQRLPRYMVPHAVRRVDSLPKNANGKVDYPRLAALLPQP
jgi:acyl-coenzyme A synthetase/AMP-(fatty) acid ligase